MGEYWESYKKPFKDKRKIEKEIKEKTKGKEYKLVWVVGEEEKLELIRGDYVLCVWRQGREEGTYPQGKLKIIEIV